jgi:hypothetical protein
LTSFLGGLITTDRLFDKKSFKVVVALVLLTAVGFELYIKRLL